jgi:hypothetical protein
MPPYAAVENKKAAIGSIRWRIPVSGITLIQSRTLSITAYFARHKQRFKQYSYFFFCSTTFCSLGGMYPYFFHVSATFVRLEGM